MIYEASTTDKFRQAAERAEPGDSIVLMPGEYKIDSTIDIKSGVGVFARHPLGARSLGMPSELVNGPDVDTNFSSSKLDEAVWRKRIGTPPADIS